MKRGPIISGKRKSVNLSIDSGVVAAARELGINLSKIAGNGLPEATWKENERLWKEENRGQIAAWARWYEHNGNPLEKYRLF